MVYKKLVLFRNPDEFTSMYIERVNPDHVGIIWGKQHKKFNKGTHFIRVGKIFFMCIPVVYGLSVVAWLDMFTSYMYDLLVTVGILGFFVSCILSIFIYYIPFKLSNKKGVVIGNS